MISIEDFCILSSMADLDARPNTRHTMLNADANGSTASLASRDRAQSEKRKGLAKVRTGCITCKFRRVKCDEEKPYCRRCIQSDRKCDGYAMTKTNSGLSTTLKPVASTSIPSPLRSGPAFESSNAHRSFHFYHAVTAPSLAVEYDASLWTSVVPMLCESEPSILHAMLAVSILSESLIHKRRKQHGKHRHEELLALQHYNKAISFLQKRLNGQEPAELVTSLIVSILFACLEFIWRRVKVAVLHLHQGRKILSSISVGQQISKSHLHLIHEEIAPILLRTGPATTLYGSYSLPVPPGPSTPFEIPSAFRSSKQASYSLHTILDDALRWRMLVKAGCQRAERLSTDFCYKIPVTSLPRADLGTDKAQQLKEQKVLISRLHAWYSALNEWHATSPKRSRPARSTLIFEIHWHTTTLWTATALCEEETGYDEQLDRFSAIVRLCTEYLEYTGDLENGKQKPSRKPVPASETTSHESPFSFETGVVPALFLTAAKCRHAKVRRRAADLLQKYGWRLENLWNAGYFGSIASRIVDIEVGNSICSCRGDKESREVAAKPDDATRPTAECPPITEENTESLQCRCSMAPFGLPEHARISDLQIGRHEGESVRVTFFMNTTKPESDWITWDELVKVR